MAIMMEGHEIDALKLISTNGTEKTVQLTEEGVIPTPTASMTITENGTHDVTEYAEVEVAVESGGGSGLLAVQTFTLEEDYTATSSVTAVVLPIPDEVRSILTSVAKYVACEISASMAVEDDYTLLSTISAPCLYIGNIPSMMNYTNLQSRFVAPTGTAYAFNGIGNDIGTGGLYIRQVGNNCTINKYCKGNIKKIQAGEYTVKWYKLG